MKSSAADTDSMHGVWQAPPVERLASAPGGVELIVRIAGFGCVNWPNLDSDEQLANARAHATIAIGRGILLSVFFVQSKFARDAGDLPSLYAAPHLREELYGAPVGDRCGETTGHSRRQRTAFGARQVPRAVYRK